MIEKEIIDKITIIELRQRIFLIVLVLYLLIKKIIKIILIKVSK